jgi:type II secretory pathway component PulF
MDLHNHSSHILGCSDDEQANILMPVMLPVLLIVLAGLVVLVVLLVLIEGLTPMPPIFFLVCVWVIAYWLCGVGWSW